MTDLALNERAWGIADRMAARAAELRLAVQTLASGARVIDAGIAVPGGFGAGYGLADLCLGGLANISYTTLLYEGTSYPGVQVWTDHPAIACMASQYAGWAISVGKYFAMGSGPLRCRARVETELFAKLEYGEKAARGVLVLEGRTPPTDEVAAWVAGKAGLAPTQITFAIAPTASVAGGVQVVARILETGLHKMEVLGFDVRRVVSGIGTAPLPPIAKSDLRAI
ncbi:MAG TPA: methenyltetrahydromethanopterin cyclohydrolase, partial [Gemmatimonadaceae bacterium]|nr:methenyltetrahydromethanopterin cyclohydrolase [Gemmatimonadaceae bacterium]